MYGAAQGSCSPARSRSGRRTADTEVGRYEEGRADRSGRRLCRPSHPRVGRLGESAASGSDTLGVTLLLVEIAVVVVIRTAGLRTRALPLAQRQETREAFGQPDDAAYPAAEGETSAPSPQQV